MDSTFFVWKVEFVVLACYAVNVADGKNGENLRFEIEERP